MDKFIAFFSLISFLVSCGGVTDNSTLQSFTTEYRTRADQPPAPEIPVSSKTDSAPEPEQEPLQEESPKPEQKKNHIITDDFYTISNKGSGWGFVKKKGKEPEIYQSTQNLFALYNTYYLDPARSKKIYLTFDEGYENGYTSIILDTLKEHNVKAAFFITGPYLNQEQELVDRMINEGHIVGNHTVNHPNLHKLSDPQKMADELGNLNSIFFDRYGTNMKYMRPPEGEYSPRLLAVANSLGYKTVFWSFAYKDWDTSHQKGADYAFNQVTPYLHDGAILLLHAVSKDNTEALGRIITYAKEQGYEFATLDELANY